MTRTEHFTAEIAERAEKTFSLRSLRAPRFPYV
jgi:hypothetical protein